MLTLITLTSCSNKQDVSVIETDLPYIAVFSKTNMFGSFNNYIKYSMPGEEIVLTEIETTRYIHKVLLDDEKEKLYGISDIGIFEIDYKNGTYINLSSETTTSAYNYDDDIYYHLNIGGDEVNYETKICGVNNKSCETFDYYASFYTKNKDNWFVVERDQKMPDESFFIHKYGLDFKEEEVTEVTKYTNNHPPAVVMLDSGIYNVHDSGIITDQNNNIIYESNELFFTDETEVNAHNNYIIVSVKDPDNHEITSHKIIDIKTNEEIILDGNGYTSVSKQGVYYVKEDEYNSYFRYYDFEKKEVSEIITDNEEMLYTSILILKK